LVIPEVPIEEGSSGPLLMLPTELVPNCAAGEK
jgi:hypothetical protein